VVVGILLALQLAGPANMTIRAGNRTVVVPITQTAGGASIRADLLGPALAATVRQLPNGHYVLTLGGAEIDIAERVPFARVGADVYPLAVAPVVVEGRLFVPMQLLSDVVPRVVRGVTFDAARDEMRVSDSAFLRRVSSANDPAVRDSLSAPAGIVLLPSTPPPRSNKRKQRIVVIDAGHGGPDYGMDGPMGRGPRIVEKDITLAVAKRVATALRARGMTVVMTRTTDTLIALSDRGRIANRNHGDLFLSIHVNAANPNWKEPAATRGFETYFLAEAKTEEALRVERMENEAVRFETGVHAPKGDPLAFIINDMAQNEHLRESSDLAGSVQRSLMRVHPGPSRGVRQANFAVLRTSFMPAVLIEIGFGTNRSDAAFLSEGTRQQRIAGAIAEATVDYLNRYERRVTPGTR
jgi:N-acetylmuramoyl-L-alanine amidase